MAKEYVAYTRLGSYSPGDVVDPSAYSAEQWQYMVVHDVVVPRNSPNDPNVLEERLSETTEMTTRGEPAALNAKEQAAMDAYNAAVAKPDSKTKATTPEAKSESETKADSPSTGGSKAPEVKPVAPPSATSVSSKPAGS
jgi:hypothetical protein